MKDLRSIIDYLAERTTRLGGEGGIMRNRGDMASFIHTSLDKTLIFNTISPKEIYQKDNVKVKAPNIPYGSSYDPSQGKGWKEIS